MTAPLVTRFGSLIPEDRLEQTATNLRTSSWSMLNRGGYSASNGRLWERVAEGEPSGKLAGLVAGICDRDADDWDLSPVRYHDPDDGDVMDDLASGVIRAGVRVR